MPEEIDDATLETAKSTLIEAGAPEDVLEGLEPEKIVDWAANLPEAKADDDDDIDDRLKSLVEKMEADYAKVESATADEGGDDDDAGADKGDEKVSSDGAESIKTLRDGIMTLGHIVQGIVVKDAKERLSESYPSISEKGNMDKVLKRAQVLLGSGEYIDVNEAIDDAAKLIFKEQGAKDKLAQFRRGGSPETASRKDGGSKATDEKFKKMSNEEKSDAIGKLICEGNREEAERLSALVM